MTKPAIDQPRNVLSGVLEMIFLGSAIGACYGAFFGWRADGLDGLVTRAVLERAAKSGIGTAIGFLVAKTLARRLDFSAMMGAIIGLLFPAVNDLPISAVIPSALLGGAWCGLLSRFELLPGFERHEIDQGDPALESPIEEGGREPDESEHVH
jgi:hypothetical protein